MLSLNELQQLITNAFGGVAAPPPWALVNSQEGDEPALLMQEFSSVPAWRAVDHQFLDRAPDGFGTALSFFSDEAFRYYLPAYLLAWLNDSLEHSDPIFHLTNGLQPRLAATPINPQRYGARTWRDHAYHRFSLFDTGQCRAIAEFLVYAAASERCTLGERSSIDSALNTYWWPRMLALE